MSFLNRILTGSTKNPLPQHSKEVGHSLLDQKIPATISNSSLKDREFAELEINHYKVELEKKREELKQIQDIRNMRVLYAEKSFDLLATYIYSVLLIVFLNSFIPGFHLSDQVLITLITTTLGSIGIFFYVIIKFLFKN